MEDVLKDPEHIASLLDDLLVTIYESRATKLGEKMFMVSQSMANMTFESDEHRSRTYEMLATANGIPQDQEALILYRNELVKRLSERTKEVEKQA